jgi:uncharacterized protein with PQ loop repeat
MLHAWDQWLSLFRGIAVAINVLVALLSNRSMGRIPLTRFVMIFGGLATLCWLMYCYLPNNSQQSPLTCAAALILQASAAIFAFIGFGLGLLALASDNSINAALPWVWLRRLAELQAETSGAERAQAQARRVARRQARAARRQA